MFALRNVATTTRRTAMRTAAPAMSRAFSDTIPVNKVARVVRTHVGNEANAIEVDKILDEGIALAKSLPGYAGTSRTVCKAEWAYEVAFVYETHADFKNFMEKKDELGFEKVLEKVNPYTEGETYVGNRVYDDK